MSSNPNPVQNPAPYENAAYSMVLNSDALSPEEDDDMNLDQEKDENVEMEEEKQDDDEEGDEGEAEKIGEEELDADELEDENEEETQEQEDLKLEKKDSKFDEDPIEKLKERAIKADFYDIIPTLAIPMATNVNTFAFTSDMKWLFTGGEDGYIRKYDFFPSINGDLSLTVAQRHPFVDTVTKAGILLNYWGNGYDEQPPSPVYSLAVHSRGLWALSGIDNGDIVLYSTRHQEGYPVTSLKKHNAPVSCLTLHPSEKKVLSGSWDKVVHNWDLNTGGVISSYAGECGQISGIKYRPTEVPTSLGTDSDDMRSLFGTPSSNGSYDDFDEEVEKAIDEETKSMQAPEETEENAGNSNKTEKQTTLNKEKEKEKLIPEENNASSDTSLTNLNRTTMEDPNVFLTVSIDGVMNVWDHRMPDSVIKYPVPKGVPPWSMSACWGVDGSSIYVGRRNGIVEEFNIHSGTSPVRSLKMPLDSGPVSNVCPMINGRHLVIASFDNVRLYDLQSKSGIGFLIVPGHHGGLVSGLHVDPSCRFMFTASGNRGWQGTTTEVLMGYQINVLP
ncbi:SAGA complex subunit Spt8 [Schizosaccharomyces cryophilus OY26]|uniref:SAGA complex subunit Spt8 n=1 Tax=Schizosaccharomyces cryophilus (strain OY26 / ATCC MYA-4695 / CBS 11777 / NBRC 106824 / NRRL Y48691) TaxID=653667 RepID=S9WXS1_SCHCR|nr:SAGA complex subunit Spt8 [Schizosaccharomyces cryophilus OY26]EPY49507.1 SAGA complex subunit Spt8 [Schizosaccharomyces cryophilus OY26]